VPHDAGQRLGRSAAQIIKIKLRDERGRNIVLAMPAEARRVQYVALQFHEPHGTEAQLPKRARGMQQVKMRCKLWHGDRARHREAAFE